MKNQEDKIIIWDWGRTVFDKERGELFPETPKLLKYAARKGYRQALISLAIDSDFNYRYLKLAEGEIGNFFELVLFHKSQKDHLLDLAASHFKAPLENMTLVDDRVIRGVSWGNARGCRTIWIKKGKFADEEPTAETGQPSYTVENLTELYNIL